MITFIAGVVVGWAALAVGAALLIGAAIANAPKPAPMVVPQPEPVELYVPSEWSAA